MAPTEDDAVRGDEMSDRKLMLMGLERNCGEEGKLRGKYVQQLADSESELGDIAEKIAQLKAQIEQTEAQIDQMMAALG